MQPFFHAGVNARSTYPFKLVLLFRVAEFTPVPFLGAAILSRWCSLYPKLSVHAGVCACGTYSFKLVLLSCSCQFTPVPVLGAAVLSRWCLFLLKQFVFPVVWAWLIAMDSVLMDCCSQEEVVIFFFNANYKC